MRKTKAQLENEIEDLKNTITLFRNDRKDLLEAEAVVDMTINYRRLCARNKMLFRASTGLVEGEE